MPFENETHPGETGFRTEPPEDWSVVTQSQTHVLVGGVAIAVDAFLRAVKDRAQPPIREVRATAFEAPAHTDGTLILRGVEALDRGQQVMLLGWLETPQNKTRVIATSATPVYLLVQAEAFLERLFYRLNVVHITVVPG
jgi:hypothetical protein